MTARCTDGVIGIAEKIPAYLVLEGLIVTGYDEDDIPEGVVAIDDMAGCMYLESVVLPSSVTVIGEGAFSNCASLVSVTIPGSVKAVGRSRYTDSPAHSKGTHLLKAS